MCIGLEHCEGENLTSIYLCFWIWKSHYYKFQLIMKEVVAPVEKEKEKPTIINDIGLVCPWKINK
jgi:hypothetical protein